MVEPAQNRSDSDPTMAGLRLRNRCLQAEAAVRGIVDVVIDELGQAPAEMTPLRGIRWSRHSRRTILTQRSTMEFARGARIGPQTLETQS